MTRRRKPAPVDRARDRPNWRGLVRLAHRTVETPTPAQREALAGDALRARSLWVPVEAYPRGLVCNVVWSLCLAYAREDDAERRGRLEPMMLAAAGMLDELLTQVEAAPTPGLRGRTPSLIVTDEAPGRLPYAEN
ncbi:hypothetical protein [Brevundimonas naejangsanensis]|uniref:hypothetical protein n=1 Tax=Brevundimonas naejangsanensis TaxID=588932 RepID=UPI0026EC86C4|nr:hypothetical protein [Brevundimonas naejangsanensis]